ncbi:MAG: DUF421 domain-containing protein [Bacillota bacterium]|jgi:uncharacterized membrane protein YcaP (DUF421 family)
MELFRIALTALGSLLVLFILTKIMGNKQMSQLSMFDYINGITIGSIAAEMATSLEDDFIKPLVAMTVYAIVVFLISIITNKSVRMRRILTGKPILLFQHGKIYEKNLSKAKLDISDFLTQCRTHGYFNLDDIQTAFLETNGRISFLPLANKRPITAADLNIDLPEEWVVANVIMDGHIMKKNLHFSGNNESWLKKELQAQNIDDIEDVFLATCDHNNNLKVYKKTKQKLDKDVFE